VKKYSLTEIELMLLISNAVRAEVSPLHEEISSLKDEVARIMPQERVKTVADICREFGYARHTVLRHPWLMPNWGRSDYPGRVRRWKAETYRDWFKKATTDREYEWHSLSIKQKARTRKEAQA
jgi:hypothetical protein